jgi:T-complex protein 1 subunit alpha
MVVDAVLAVKNVTANGTKYPINAVNILKAHEKLLATLNWFALDVNRRFRSYALNCTVASQALVKKMVDAKIACLDINLQKARMHLGVNIVIDDPDKLENIRRREIEITTEKIKKIL